MKKENLGKRIAMSLFALIFDRHYIGIATFINLFLPVDNFTVVF